YSYTFSLFSSHCSALTRDLHSFPTRRSSDLPARRPGTAADSLSRTRRQAGPGCRSEARLRLQLSHSARPCDAGQRPPQADGRKADRKSTRLNSSHVAISYAVFCLKKKKQKTK